MDTGPAEYGERAPKVVRDPVGVPKGGLAYY